MEEEERIEQERLRIEEEEERRMNEETERIASEARRAEEERIQRAIEVKNKRICQNFFIILHRLIYKLIG